MNSKIHLFLLLLALAFCGRSVSQSEDKSPQDLNQNLLTSFGSLIEQYGFNISWFSSFKPLSQPLNEIGISWGKLMTRHSQVAKINQSLQKFLDSARNDSLSTHPTDHERNLQQKADQIRELLPEMRICYQILTQKFYELPLDQIFDANSKKYVELTQKASILWSEHDRCSDDYFKVLYSFERVEHQQSAASRQLQVFNKSILLQKNIIKKKSALLKSLERQSQEEEADQVSSEEKIKLLQEIKKAEDEIEQLEFKKDRIRPFATTLANLEEGLASKEQACNKIQESIRETEEEMKRILNLENSEVGVATQANLINGMNEIKALKEITVKPMGLILTKLETDIYALKNFLKDFDFKSLQESILENADFYLPQVYNKESCIKNISCLLDLFIDKVPNFSPQIPLSTHLSTIFTQINSVNFMLKDEKKEFSRMIEHFIKNQLVAQKKKGSSVTSWAQFIVDKVFDSKPTLFINIEEELKNEMIALGKIYSWIRNHMKKDYEELVRKLWKGHLKEEIYDVSSSNMLIGPSLAAPSS